MSTELTKKQKYWCVFKKKLVTLFGSLIMEKDPKGDWVMSIGRVSWWLALMPAMYIWLRSGGLLEGGVSVRDIAPNHLTVLLTLAAYNFGKKVVDTAENIWGKKDVGSDGPG